MYYIELKRSAKKYKWGQFKFNAQFTHLSK